MSSGVKGQGEICGEGENKAAVMAVVTGGCNTGTQLSCCIIKLDITTDSLTDINDKVLYDVGRPTNLILKGKHLIDLLSLQNNYCQN